MSTTDLYQLLFGKAAIQDGNVIDMAEHNRIGGVSTGKGFKNVQILDNNGNPITSFGTGDASAANQTNGAQKTQIVDSSGNVIGSTSNALNVNLQNSSVPVTGTFYQATQPVSLISLPALPTGANVIGHVITDSGSTVILGSN